MSAREEGFVDDNLVTAGRRNATERVAMLLMHLYRRLDRIGLATQDTDDQPAFVEFPINQQHIADTLGLSLVHTNKTLRRLQKMGLHELKNGRLRLLNTKALERIADYYDKPLRRVPLLQRTFDMAGLTRRHRQAQQQVFVAFERLRGVQALGCRSALVKAGK